MTSAPARSPHHASGELTYLRLFRSYPVSQFLTTYRIPLPAPPATYASPWLDTFRVSVKQVRLNAVKQTRTVDIVLQHPGIMWPVIAFDADVVAWGEFLLV